MKCKKCKDNAVISGFCEKHFVEYFEKKVKATIKEFNLISKKDRVVVAVSGGKDSIATLYLLKKFGYNVEGLAINEGIAGYRKKTLDDLKNFSKKEKVKVKIISFQKEFGLALDDAVKKTKETPCHVCGVLRRFLLNKYSKDYDVIATGHNLDDEAQAVMMNIFKAQTELLSRLGPVSGIKIGKGFTKRVKPLYFLKEKEVKVYTILKGFSIGFVECPYTHMSFRSEVQKALNEYESKHVGAKMNIIKSFLKGLPGLKRKFKTKNEVSTCKICGEPAANETCRTCFLIKKIGSF